MTIDISHWHLPWLPSGTLAGFAAGFIAILAFDPTWSTGNIITIGVVFIGGLTAFYGIIGKLTTSQLTTTAQLTTAQQKQDQALELMSAHQEAAMGLMNQSVVLLKETVTTMQVVLTEQRSQLSAMVIETEVNRRLQAMSQSQPKV
jgi:hypothetical protein